MVRGDSRRKSLDRCISSFSQRPSSYYTAPSLGKSVLGGRLSGSTAPRKVLGGVCFPGAAVANRCKLGGFNQQKCTRLQFRRLNGVHWAEIKGLAAPPAYLPHLPQGTRGETPPFLACLGLIAPISWPLSPCCHLFCASLSNLPFLGLVWSHLGPPHIISPGDPPYSHFCHHQGHPWLLHPQVG